MIGYVLATMVAQGTTGACTCILKFCPHVANPHESNAQRQTQLPGKKCRKRCGNSAENVCTVLGYNIVRLHYATYMRYCCCDTLAINWWTREGDHVGAFFAPSRASTNEARLVGNWTGGPWTCLNTQTLEHLYAATKCYTMKYFVLFCIGDYCIDILWIGALGLLYRSQNYQVGSFVSALFGWTLLTSRSILARLQLIVQLSSCGHLSLLNVSFFSHSSGIK